MNIALLLAGGTASRFGGETPKQYIQLNGAEVISYSIHAMKHSAHTDRIICAADRDHVQRLREVYQIETIPGGDSRNQSVRNGLEYIKRQYPQCGKVLIHEAARPFLTPEWVDDYWEKLDQYDSVITAQRITDSLGRFGEAVTDRSEYYLIQAPEAFRFELLYKHFNAESSITATGQHLPPDTPTYLNFGFRGNMKITYPEDAVIAEAMMRYRNGEISGI